MRVLVLHNPGAGDGRLDGAAIRALFESEGHTVCWRDVKAHGIDAAQAGGADIVVVAGGDGTVGKSVRALAGTGSCLAVLPLGTANNVARSLGLGGDPREIAQAFASGAGQCVERALDVGVTTGPWGRRHFLEGVGLGAVAELLAVGDDADMEFAEEKRFAEEAPGPFLRTAPTRRWRVALDGALLPESLVLVEVLNMPLTGPGLPLDPGGRPDDGLLDVAYLEPQNREALADWLDGPRIGWPEGLARVSGRRVAFEWGEGPLRIDDDFPDPPPGGEAAPVEVTLAPDRMRFLIPRQRGAP
jgi:diacylglycerol kinase (ATP)